MKGRTEKETQLLKPLGYQWPFAFVNNYRVPRDTAENVQKRMKGDTLNVGALSFRVLRSPEPKRRLPYLS